MTLLRWTAMLVLILALAACTGVPDRSAEARQLETDLKALPGVDGASVRYTNDFTHGTHIEIGVRADRASEQQIAEIATKLNELRGNDFDDFEQSISFSVAPTATVAIGSEIAPEVIARGTAEARRIATMLAAPSDFFTLRPGTTGSSLNMDSATDPDRAVAVAVEVIGQHAGHIDIRGKQNESEPSVSWDITGPLTVERYTTLREQLEALPGSAGFMQVKDGHFRQVNLTLPSTDTETAYRDVASTVRILGGTAEHPLRLAWGVPTKPREPRWAGSVDVGGCVNDIDITAPEKLVPDAQVVQQRIRDEFSDCP